MKPYKTCLFSTCGIVKECITSEYCLTLILSGNTALEYKATGHELPKMHPVKSLISYHYTR